MRDHFKMKPTIWSSNLSFKNNFTI